jgi:F-type H+-transporting ATPase subunit a
MNIQIGAEKVFSIFGLPITNTLLMSWLVVIFLILIARLTYRKLSKVPGTRQNIIEFIIESLLGMMEGVLGSREKAEKYFPLIATIFIMVLVSNWFGIIPGLGTVGLYEGHGTERVLVPFTRSAASDLNFTLAIAIVSVIMVNVAGARALGFGKQIGKYFNFKSPIDFFLGILEFFGELARVISFSFRLFGNVFAGEVLLIIVGFLAPYFVPVPFLMLEIFVGFIQALVFSMLSLVFVSIAIEHGH